MKYPKTTFVLAVTSALCASSATASIKDDCKFLKTYGGAEMGKWVERQSKLLELGNALEETSWDEYYEKHMPENTITDARRLEVRKLKEKRVDIELTDAEEKKIRQFDADVQKRAQLRSKLEQEYKALLPVQELPPAVELGEIVTLATIYTAFCKR